jgi:hypothetical protein
MRWAKHVARMEHRRGAYKILVKIHNRKRPLQRHRRRWENNIKMDLQEMRWGNMDCVDLTQDKNRWRVIVNTVMNF